MNSFATDLNVWESVLVFIAMTAAIGGIIFAIDDLWIDLYALVHRLRPRALMQDDLVRMKVQSQKRVAIMIANWHEDEVLETMISGNLRQIEYDNYKFFLGVYPNDHETVRVARKLAILYPTRVGVIENSKWGPTTKGQMLNEIARGILRAEKEEGSAYDVFLMQDSEDVLHPKSLALVNDSFRESDGHCSDFVQFPVFSFMVPTSKLVGGTYIDEFSEIHTKDLLVRERMGAAIPSAGTGTALSRKLILMNMKSQEGNVLREDTLTEDYDLGLSAKQRGLNTRFVCAYIPKSRSQRDFIATKEYFPARLRAAVRQKTRWTLGIAFQGAKNLGWRGEWVDRYFMMRDRRGPINAILILFGFLTVVGFTFCGLTEAEVPQALRSELFLLPATVNFFSMLLRMVQRMRAVQLVYGGSIFGVPLRVPVANLVNTLAAFNAFRTHLEALITGIAPRWEKTAHVMPEGFGQTVALNENDLEGAGVR